MRMEGVSTSELYVIFGRPGYLEVLGVDIQIMSRYN
jgi:hypothetical protein